MRYKTVTGKNNSDRAVTVPGRKGDPEFAARLHAALKGKSGAWLASQLSKLGDEAKTSSQTVNAWLRAENDPGFSKVVMAARVLGVSVQWLATGEDVATEDKPSGSGAADFDQDFALLPRYEVNLSAGPGLVPAHEDVEERLAFSKAWLRRNLINADQSGLVRVRGDSMAPTVPDGALALVNTAEARVDREGIYAFSREGEAYIKRLVPLAPGPGGTPTSIVIISDGGSFPPEFVTGPQLNELRIVGRVRCILVNM